MLHLPQKLPQAIVLDGTTPPFHGWIQATRNFLSINVTATAEAHYAELCMHNKREEILLKHNEVHMTMLQMMNIAVVEADQAQLPTLHEEKRSA